MSAGGHDRLIGALVADLAPVARLPRPFARALRFLAIVPVAAAVLVVCSGHSLEDNPPALRPWVVAQAVAGFATSALAAWAAFAVSLPDRSPRWALLPLPPVVLWLAASGLGCLAAIGRAGVWGVDWAEAAECLAFILAASAPLALVIGVMLHRAGPFRGSLSMLLAGLAAASAGAGLLVLVHPHGSTVLDLAAHLVAVAIVVATSATLGGLGSR